MTTIELKKRLIDMIQATNDEELLKQATRLLEIQLEELETPYELSDEQIESVNEARIQIKNGEFLTHDEANKEISKWLEE